MNSKVGTKGIVVVGIMFTMCFLVGSKSVVDEFHIARYIAISLCLSAMFLYYVFTSKELAIPNTGLFRVVLAFMILSGLSMIWATDFGESVFAFSKYLVTFLVSLIFYNMLQEDRIASRKMIYGASCVILIIYLILTFVQILGIQDNSFNQLYNVSGISGHKNMLSLMLFILSAYSLASLSGQKNKPIRILKVLMSVMALIIVFLVKSRAVMLSVIVAAAFFCLILFANKRKVGFSSKIKLIFVIASVAASFLFFAIGLRAFSKKNVPLTSQKSEIEYNVLSTSSLSERCLLWDKTYKIIDDKPVLGCGIGNWQVEFPNSGLKGLYRADIWNVNFTRPHNEFLGVLSECGYVVFIVFLAIIFSVVVFSFSSICRTNDADDFIFGAVTLSAFIGYWVNSLFDFPSFRIEGIIWIGVMFAILFCFISKDNTIKINKLWNFLFLSLSVFFVTIGFLRHDSERNLVEIQKAKDLGDWKKVEGLASESISAFYTIDPSGMPMHWHLGKAQVYFGKKTAIENLRKAYRHSPYCKDNLNDLGLAEYFVNHDVEKAEFYLKEAIRISPNFLYPSFNLASIYLNEKRYPDAKTVLDQIYMDEQKRDLMIGDIRFFEPDNIESRRKDIENQYDVTVQMRAEIDSLLKNEN